MPALTGLIMQRKGLIRCVSLPNILMGENVVPEFLQYYCRADQISWALQDALTNDAKRKELVERFTALHESLKADTPSLVAEVLESSPLVMPDLEQLPLCVSCGYTGASIPEAPV